MSDHIQDEIPQLLRGEADKATVLGAATHLRQCEDCREELIAAVVSHASLTSAAVLLGVDETDIAPPPTDVPPPPPSERPLPDLSAVFAQVRAEVAAGTGPDESGSAAPSGDRERGPAPVGRSVRARGARWLVAAAVVGLGVGIGGSVVVAHSGSSPSAQTVPLAAFDTGRVPASARIVGGDQMRLDASALPAPSTGKLYEVWLTNAARTQMYSVGSLGANGKGSYTLPSGLMQSYSAIEVSVQPVTTSTYSGVSVLRGNY